MNAVLRVWWTFFTALPLQRWLGGTGAALCTLLAAGGFVSGTYELWIFGLLVLFILAVFPTLFASPAVFRALSAPRASQLLPRFRARMLGAVALLVATLLAIFVLFFVTSAAAANRALPLEPIGYAFAFATAMFLWMFVQFGDWRWVWLWLAAPAALGVLGLLAPESRALVAAVPAWAWPGAALLAWIGFAAWYVRARRIGPIRFNPQPRARAWASAELGGALPRDVALRMLVTARPPGREGWALALVGIVLGVNVAAMSVAAPFFSFTSSFWPFGTMLLLWGHATSIVHRSRLLWLRMPGPRDAVRREVERALLRNVRGAVLLIVAAAVIYASPLVGASPQQVLAGFLLSACAALFSTYLAFASIPGRALHLVGFGLMIALQFPLLAPPFTSPTNVTIVTVAELGGAIAFRMLALRRWRQIDWLRLRPLPQSNMFRGS